MQCERLMKLSKSWFVHVRDETMAPARMISFMKKHAEECSLCQNDPDLNDEIAKITELILPESKIPKAVRMQQEHDEMEAAAADEANQESEEDVENEDGDDEDDHDVDPENDPEGGEEDVFVGDDIV